MRFDEFVIEYLDKYPSDLVFKIKVLEHKFFKRENNDLHCNIKISL